MKRMRMMHQRLWMGLLGATVLLSLSGILMGCGSDGRACESNDECGPGFYCTSGKKCLKGCQLSVECPIGQGCRGNQCFDVTDDQDEDGFPEPIDCNDNDSLINPGASEVCGNKIDDNCNGLTDEEGCVTIECRPGDIRDCYDGKNETLNVNDAPCRQGRQTCTSSGKWGDCQGQVLPTTERCDGKDNDCDGKVDEDGDKPLSRACYKGAVGTSGVGPCKEGKQACTDGNWGDCEGEVLPQDETCNGKDDNCDGQVDNVQGAGDSCDTQQSGECAPGRKKCDPLRNVLICEQITAASEEKCDKLDNDCDGLVDNGCPYVPERVASLKSFPHAVGLSANWAAVSLRDSQRVAIFDLSGDRPKLGTEVSVQAEPHGIQVVGDRAYTITAKAVHKIDLLLGKAELVIQTPQESHAGGLVESGGNLYSRAWSKDSQGKVSLAFCKTDPTIPKITCNPPASGTFTHVGYGVALYQTSGIMLTNEGIHRFRILDVTEDPTARFGVSGQVEDISVDARTSIATILDAKSKKISLVNLFTNSLVKELEAKDSQGNFATPQRTISVDGISLVSLEESGEVAVIDISQNKITQWVKVGQAPVGMGVGPKDPNKGRQVWVTCPGDNTVWRFRLP
ncbi:MAG: hypothetical protein EP343_18485 [Deltaproteobacteria bacterium]|nr:MAG: hypothetical protein EP343_18485 [Deltaproteobacteria bacterium]